LLPLGSGLFVPARQRIPELALKHKLPGMYNNTLWVEAGGLLSYGVNFRAAYRRAAEQVGMVLNGAKPAGMPVEQSTVFELAVNLKTARALGISIPQAILLRAACTGSPTSRAAARWQANRSWTRFGMACVHWGMSRPGTSRCRSATQKAKATACRHWQRSWSNKGPTCCWSPPHRSAWPRRQPARRYRW